METVTWEKFEAERKAHLKLQVEYLRLKQVLELLGCVIPADTTLSKQGFEFETSTE
mgnify:CR=1 FL=1